MVNGMCYTAFSGNVGALKALYTTILESPQQTPHAWYRTITSIDLDGIAERS